MANTPQHSIRVNDELWQAALMRAQLDGVTLTQVLTSYLDQYAYGER
jgi:Tfp pilus assembly protein FimV